MSEPQLHEIEVIMRTQSVIRTMDQGFALTADPNDPCACELDWRSDKPYIEGTDVLAPRVFYVTHPDCV